MRTVLLLLMFAALSASASEFEKQYNAAVFAGDLSAVLDADPNTPQEKALKSRFESRFILKQEDTDLDAALDPLVAAIIRRYQDYWREALLAPADLEDAERRLAVDVLRLLALAGVQATQDEIDLYLANYLAEEKLQHRGGRTQPLLDLMLWRHTRTETIKVELTDTHQEVTVHFLEGFVVRGWSHFATFGASSTGGWADNDALYCISEAYDLESEAFANSYLRHEARHFADYRLFPALGQADLEYRAKLTELAFATDALALMQRFEERASNSNRSPHPLANFFIVQRMMAKLSASCAENVFGCLDGVPNTRLQAAARSLISEHTAKLKRLGAETVISTLAPYPEP